MLATRAARFAVRPREAGRPDRRDRRELEGGTAAAPTGEDWPGDHVRAASWLVDPRQHSPGRRRRSPARCGRTHAAGRGRSTPRLLVYDAAKHRIVPIVRTTRPIQRPTRSGEFDRGSGARASSTRRPLDGPSPHACWPGRAGAPPRAQAGHTPRRRAVTIPAGAGPVSTARRPSRDRRERQEPSGSRRPANGWPTGRRHGVSGASGGGRCPRGSTRWGGVAVHKAVRPTSDRRRPADDRVVAMLPTTGRRRGDNAALLDERDVWPRRGAVLDDPALAG